MRCQGGHASSACILALYDVLRTPRGRAICDWRVAKLASPALRTADPAGSYLIRAYKAQWDSTQAASSTATAVAGVLLSHQLLTHMALRAGQGQMQA